MQETLLIDGHVHIYPNLNLPLLIKNTLKNAVIAQRTSINRDDAIKVWMLTERSDCAKFNDLLQLPNIKGYTVNKTKEDESLLIKDADTKEPLLYIIAGRQIVTKENIEICCLGSRYSVEDKKLAIEELIGAIIQNNGIAAINWAPGKWFGKRGQIVKQTFGKFTPNQLLISDTTMRPTFWPTPKLMSTASKNGFKVIAGSDPLPFPKEEKVIAMYASIMKGEFDYERPAESVRNMIYDQTIDIIRCGKRSSTFTWLSRQIKIMSANKAIDSKS